jgi:hypothetical protein
MTAFTSACTAPGNTLRYEPHRLQTTARAVSQPAEPSTTWRLSQEQIAVLLREWAKALTEWSAREDARERATLLALYREFATEDRDLAEAGLEEFGRLLADADRE